MKVVASILTTNLTVIVCTIALHIAYYTLPKKGIQTNAMADSKPNTNASIPSNQNDIAKMTNSHDDVDVAKILLEMSSDKGTPEKDAEIRTLEHAAAQGGPAPAPSQAPNASRVSTPAPSTSNIVASIENDEVQGQNAHTSNGTIKVSASPTSLVTSDARTTSQEVQRGIVETILVTPERTILSGRIGNELSERQRGKLPAQPSGQEVENKDPMDIDKDDNADTDHAGVANTQGRSVLIPVVEGNKRNAPAQEESGSRKPDSDKGKGKVPADDQTNYASTIVETGERASLRGGALPDDNSPSPQPLADKGKGKAPADEQTSVAGIMAEAEERASLRGNGASPREETPSHRPSRAPLRAQTTTALHFLQTTANPETAEDIARRAELNNAHELARRIGLRKQVGPLPGLDFAIVDLDAIITPVQRIPTQKENRDQPVATAQGASSSDVAAPPPRPHTTFEGVYIHTAKCDSCDGRNQSVLYRCRDCSNQWCRPCMEADPIHRTDGLDWTDHGAQSASKPRSNPCAPRQRRAKVPKLAPKPKPKTKEPASKVTKQKTSVAQSRVRSGVSNLNSPHNSLAGVVDINARARRLQGPTDGADDEDDEVDVKDEDDHDNVTFMGQSSRLRMVAGGMAIGGDGRQAIDMGGGNVLGKRTREPDMLGRSAPRNFNPVGASVPHAGPSIFQQPLRATTPRAGAVTLAPRSQYPGLGIRQPAQQIKQEDEDEDEGEAYISDYDRDNNAKEAKAEKERAAKRHKGPVKRGALSQDRVNDEDDEESATERGTPAPALQVSRRPAITFRRGGQTQTRTPAWARSPLAGQNEAAQAGRAPRSASPAGLSPDVHSFLATTDQLRSDYTRVTQEEAKLEERLAKAKAEKAKIEKSFANLMK